ncbi:hypothetical protein GZ77_25150 [Endozoicomonas montiporae]|uniref:DUF2956 domain-containing protein n=2 Tax=Endozoicomonas montiporae TaxID=1027273 RepID=A0A081MYX8_9GAMM|nr:DUF2956 domain-containing protein [Endozoicomonas montiporae]AMO54867.1 hypothetical protein EZMO1_0627 [Endozoicomonas montiporae CL-33]KEQ11401.1 hypothetical protein GZ77_25150 [Endozoicomonas montiporae]
MTNTAKKNTVSIETKKEALKIARATQKPGQSKEQTRLIAMGIQKGIDQYKKQQKAKARELDKRLKMIKRHRETKPVVEKITETTTSVVYRQNRLPWILLGLSWATMAGYLYYLNI